MPPRIAIVAGTRPEVIKLAPVVEELRRRNVEPTIISTGQHTSLLRGTPAESTMAPHWDLNLPSSNDPITYPGLIKSVLQRHWRETAVPDTVVVQGDTASAYAAAEAAYGLNILVAHVEAGIRSGNPMDPWPEEGFRTRIDQVASRWYCATENNYWNLSPNPGGPNRMDEMITGNSGIDALYSHTVPTKEVHDRVLITLHRRESFGEPLADMIGGIFAAGTKYPHLEFMWPSHPNPRVQSQLAARWPETPENVLVRGPLETIPFAQQLSTCRVVITDSGGVQEEAAALGIPCIVAREKTDRPESVDLGLAKVVGRTEQGILDGLDWALSFTQRPDPSYCFGDGHAAPRIVSHLLESL